MLARSLHLVGSLLREGVHTAVHIGFGLEIHLLNRLDHATGSLRSGGAVEIDERFPLDGSFQYREIFPNLFNIKNFAHRFRCG